MANGEYTTYSLAETQTTSDEKNTSITDSAYSYETNTSIADSTGTHEKLNNVIYVDSFESAYQQIEQAFTSYLEVRYSKFPYHNIEHAREVQLNALSFFDSLAESSEGKIELVKDSMTQEVTPELRKKAEDPKELEKLRTYLSVIALGHDIIQVANVSKKTGMLERSRGMGDQQSEGETAKFIYDYMQKFVNASGERIFADFSLERVMRDIDSTTVAFSMKKVDSKFLPADTEVLYIDTPSIDETSSAMDVLLAVADLKIASGGEDTMAQFNGSNKEFRELHAWIGTALENGIENLSTEQKADLGLAALNWVNTQKGFLVGQEQIYEGFLAKINNPILQEVLEAKVNKANFEKNIQASIYRADYLNESYKLTIIAAKISSLESNLPNLDPKQHEQLQKLYVERTSLSNNPNYIKPGNRTHGALTESETMSLDKAVAALVAEMGYKH